RRLAVPSWIPPSLPERPRSPVELLGVVPPRTSENGLLDAALLLPNPSSESPYDHTYAFAFEGWVLASDGGSLTVELRGGSMPPSRVVADFPSPEAAARYPDTPRSDRCGFQFVRSSLELPLEFELEVDAITDAGKRTLGQIRGRRHPLRTPYEPMFQPLLVT